MSGYSFSKYQSDAIVTAAYPGQGSLMGLAYASLGLTGEAGETVEQVKKTWRDDGVTLETFGTYKVEGERREKILKELGDLLWYAAQVCTELRADLGDVAEGNIAKLRARQSANLIHGEGSDREVVKQISPEQEATTDIIFKKCRRGTLYAPSMGACGCCHDIARHDDGRPKVHPNDWDPADRYDPLG